MTTRWPGISMLVSLILTLSPLGRDIVDSAFFAGEALSRNIWAPIALTIFAVMAAAILSEWLIRSYIRNRRARGATTA
ncbi:hypothetical protein ABIF65_003081 [Bradyrhizobium japonicum]|jgi:hypothetical protein|uniref:hypothetical protein n=1 Tax=Bradyrhizobium TaxID=374 RepID=UPI000414C1F2|nr:MULTISPECIES: hypothetical protein [Bradyrhizobium]MBR0879869.1 hypothetical protein [Bradyrhizobium liaoningense]MBR0942008.1 hypothetical protein [Bradyrhizobium liaoningense]MBR0999815.1 hypothetical protein [Bradyrhizobium liaoningense]MBR1031762.1 hypothetical protein [Bradyrhizobium liaoningense]MBR1064672.1 hypothetical protein [Bradyrhizobium liaoningense]